MNQPASPLLLGISSMATARLLEELSALYHQATGLAVRFESAGGVDVAKRVAAGEAFDLVVLDAERIDQMIQTGRVLADGRVNVANSCAAAAVRAGQHRPDISSRAALIKALLAARSIGYSTGPSGLELLKHFDQWGIADAVRARLVQAAPGVPVGSLIASGEAELGFQQLGELMPVAGIEILGTLPADAEIVSTFSAAMCTVSRHHHAVQEFLAFLVSPVTSEAKLRYGMAPALSH